MVSVGWKYWGKGTLCKVYDYVTTKAIQIRLEKKKVHCLFF